MFPSLIGEGERKPPAMLRHTIAALSLAATLAPSVACTTVVIVTQEEIDTTGEAEDEDEADTTDAAEPMRPDTTTGAEESTGEAETTDTSGEAEDSTGATTGGENSPTTTDDAASTSTGEPALTPDGGACAHAAECESGVCGLGVCMVAAPQSCEEAPAQCGDAMQCVQFDGGAACVVTGEDGQGAEIAPNDSPAGDIDFTDLDVWSIANVAAGSYVVKLKANGAAKLHIVAADGEVLADPTTALQPDDIATGFVDYVITLDYPQTVTVAVRGTTLETAPYYFYTVNN